MCSVSLQAQKKKKKPHKGTEVADSYFRDYAYYQATELYLEALKKGDSSKHVLQRLADSYYNISDVKLASFWFEKTIKKYPKIHPDYIYKYIQTLRSLGDYELANEWIEKFKQRAASDGRIDDVAYSMENYENLMDTERVYVEYKNLDLNTEYSDYGALKHGDTLYFSSTRVKDTILDKKKLYDWNQEPFLDIFQVSVTQEGQEITYDEVQKVGSSEINTPLHESSVAITSDGKTMYFTSDNGSKAGSKRIKGKRGKDGTVNLKLFKATLVGNQWGNVKSLPFNNRSFSNGNPALSPDDKTLFFSSDREGSYGQSDLYMVEILENDKYGEPQNLGGKINTPGRENFPFVAKDSTLYFSSDAHLNLGLYDIFESNILKKRGRGDAVEIKNLGAPYNSSSDDFAFSIDSTNVGFFSSNRPGGKGGDDIYSFGKFECKQLFKGFTKDKLTLDPLPETTVKLIDGNGKVLEEITSDENGYFEFKDIACDTKYVILGEKIIYKSDQNELTTSSSNGEETDMQLMLEPLIQDGEIVINPIFFDYNKSNIRSDAAYELENIVVVLKTHPKMTIKIESHSDSRGRAAYNEKLSDRRAKSTRDYLFSRGIETNRIESAIGYGEAHPLNHCVDGVKCTDEEYEANRRSKFIITSENY